MKSNRNNILTEEVLPTTPFFNKQGTQKSSVNDAAQNQPNIQRKCAECAAEENEKEPPVQKKEGLGIQQKDATTATTPPPPVTEAVQTTTPANAPGAARFITDDNAVPEAGQMRKTAFTTRLKAEVCETVNQAMAGTPFTSDNCPYIQTLFAIHENSSPARIEALIFRYCPAAIQAQSADELIQHIKAKAFTVTRQWAENGGNAGAAAQIFNGVASGVGSIAGSIASGVGNAVSAVSSLFFKENTGGATNTQSPQAVMQSLGKGSSIESSTKSKMEGAFGESFSNVEVHTDSNAAQLSKDMNARAFTVGNHIAFAGGEHQPGTIEGDALMAHELAHTIQQSGGATNDAQMKGSAYNALEEDADGTAMEVMTKMTGREDIQLKNKVKKGLKTGLTVSRCKGCNSEETEKKSMTQEIIDDPVKSDKGRVVNVRDEINQNTLVQDLARIDILGATGKPVKKKINNVLTEVYEVSMSATSFTEPWVTTEFNKIFPESTEITMTKKSDAKYVALKKLIADYRAKHPNSFSKLQGHNMMDASCQGACIGTFNRGVEKLYGTNTLDTSGMKDTAFGTIDELKKKKFIDKSNTIKATYDKSLKIAENESEISLGASIGGEMNDIVQKEEDGVHPFLLSVGNGYHSISIIFYKMGGTTEILWRDQHWEDPAYNQKTPMTIAEVDQKIKSYLVLRSKSWAREFYNKKNTPQIGVYSDIPEGEKKDAAKKDAESTVRQDLAVNRYGKLNPVDNK
jgi:Domain of unknown function (DUF4157)